MPDAVHGHALSAARGRAAGREWRKGRRTFAQPPAVRTTRASSHNLRNCQHIAKGKLRRPLHHVLSRSELSLRITFYLQCKTKCSGSSNGELRLHCASRAHKSARPFALAHSHRAARACSGRANEAKRKTEQTDQRPLQDEWLKS